MAVEHIDKPGEVHQGTAEAINLVDHHNVYPARFDVSKETLQGRALQRAASISRICL